MNFQDTLNGKNLLTEFGLIIQTGTAELLAFPERKVSLSNDWREENGIEYDLELPRFKDKEVTLQCAILADDDEVFWSFYDAFFSELKKAGWQDLYIFDHTKSYEVFYKKCGTPKKTLKRLKNVQKVIVKFPITLQINY